MEKSKIFIVGTITHNLPEKFKIIEKSLKKEFNCISTYDKNILGEDKIKWVYETIDNSDLIVALFPQISFGTSFELGYSVAKNKKVILITSTYILELLKEHPVIFSENITPINYEDYDKIIKTIRSLL